MKYARIINNTAVDTRDTSPEGCFTPNIVAEFVEVPDDVQDNWTLADGVWSAPPPPPPPLEPAPYDPPPPPVDPCEWLIDIGAFYDRFGAAKMAVLVSQDATVKAIMDDVAIRKWIDLQRADVAQALAYIGSVVPSVDATLQASILTTPVSAVENMALRKLYFS